MGVYCQNGNEKIPREFQMQISFIRAKSGNIIFHDFCMGTYGVFDRITNFK